MKSKHHIIKIFLLFFICSGLHAQNDGTGNTGMAFLKLGVGARAIAMGEAVSSIADDATAYIYNPARLNFGATSNVSLMHNISVQDLNTDYIASKFFVSNKVTLCVGFYTTSISNIEIRNTPGAAIDNFDSRNLSTGISFGYKINPTLSIGVTGKFLFEKIYVDEASGLGFDFGTNYSKDNFSFAFVISNLGSMNELKNQSSKLPSSVRFGGSYKYLKKKLGLTFGLDGYKVLDGGKFHALAGGEAGYNEFVFLRLGYQSSYDNKGFSTGIGFKYKTLSVDYAFVPYQNEFGTSNAFSLGINF